MISIHALLAESDQAQNLKIPAHRISIHALLAESDAPSRHPCRRSRNFYPRSPCGERQYADGYDVRLLTISIHALLAESDRCSPGAVYNAIKISIHALLAESDPHASDTEDIKHKFLSTLSLRRATRLRPLDVGHIPISIHALLAESDAALYANFPSGF